MVAGPYTLSTALTILSPRATRIHRSLASASRDALHQVQSCIDEPKRSCVLRSGNVDTSPSRAHDMHHSSVADTAAIAANMSRETA